MWKGEQEKSNEKDTDTLINDFIKIIKPNPFTAAFISTINKWRQTFENEGNLIVKGKLLL